MKSMSKASRIATTCDAWTSVATDSFVTIKAHYISEDWQLLSRAANESRSSKSHGFSSGRATVECRGRMTANR